MWSTKPNAAENVSHICFRGVSTWNKSYRSIICSSFLSSFFLFWIFSLSLSLCSSFLSSFPLALRLYPSIFSFCNTSNQVRSSCYFLPILLPFSHSSGFFFGSIFIFTSTFTFIFVFVFVLISIFIVIIYDSYIFIYYRQLGASFSQRFSVEGSLQTPSIRWRKRILAALNGGGISFQKDPGEMANDIGRILRVISWFQRLFPTPSDPKNEWN